MALVVLAAVFVPRSAASALRPRATTGRATAGRAATGRAGGSVPALVAGGITTYAPQEQFLRGMNGPSAVAVDAAGNIVLGGSFGGSVDFGGGPLVATAGHPSAFLVRLDPNGKHLWSQTFATEDAVLQGVAVGADGRIAATGT
ncbi:MAG: hypothetical protein QOF20_624, partial [Acidimicrobiaceae bacterium]|nr:hypothetical protein [Acidimicrobiaceae bacterium]